MSPFELDEACLAYWEATRKRIRSNPTIIRPQKLAHEVAAELRASNAELRLQVNELVEALRDAKLQIQYLHEKFSETGSGNAIVARLEILLARKQP